MSDLLPSNAAGVWADAYKLAVASGDERATETAWDAVKSQGWIKEETGRWRKTDKRLLRASALTTLAMLRMAIATSLAKDGWSKQPRVPSGSKGGQWTTGGGFGGSMKLPTPEQQITAPHLGQGGIARHRFESDPIQQAFVAPLKQTEITGKPAFLDNPHGYVLMEPSTPTKVQDNGNPEDVATYIPDGDPGPGLNGTPFKPWDPPEDWAAVAGQGKFDEPPIPDAKGKRLGAGVIIEEPDGRIWTVNPLNQFGGYRETFPKGGIEEGLDLRQTAIKEAWEESGLKVELTGYIGDFERTTSVARYYRAKRVTGDPTDAHWETQSVNAVPLTDLADRVVHHADAPIIAALMGETASVQKALCVLADLIDLADYSASAEQRSYTGLAKAKGGAWQKQMRVPKGLPKGGEWTVYGSGTIGGAYAAGGVALELQKHMGAGQQSIDLNAKIQIYQDAANNGYLHPDAMKVLAGPMSTQTYMSAKWTSAAEAKAYVDAGGMANVPSKADAVLATKSEVQTTSPPKTMAEKMAEVEAQDAANAAAYIAAGNFPKTLSYSPAHTTHIVNLDSTAAGTYAGVYAIHVSDKLGTKIDALGISTAGAKWLPVQTGSGTHNAVLGAYLTGKGKPAGQPAAPDITPPKPKIPPTGTFGDPLKLSDMPKVGAKPGGTAAGGIHIDAHGQKWLVKSYNTSLQAQNEVAASKIYGAIGVETPHMKLVDLGDAYKGGLGVASKYLEDVVPFNVNNPAHLNAVQANFGAHAMMADWDAVGASFDNIMINKESGVAVLVDPGGAMLFRAMGDPKGAKFTDTVGEINSMRDPVQNHTGAKVFGPMTESAIANSAMVASVGFTDSTTQISNIIDSYIPGPTGVGLKAKLMKRAVDLGTQANQLQANFASSTGVGIAKTGTTTATPMHANPNITAAAALTGADAKANIDDLNSQLGDAQMALSGGSAEFYSAKINDLNTIASTGDVEAVKAAFYVPGHAAKGNKLSVNYSTYLKAHAAAIKKAEAVAGQQLKGVPEAHAGSMVTGNAKITPAQVESAKQLGEASKMAGTLEPSVALHIEPTPAPKPVTPQVLTPAANLPKKPFIDSTPKNPNTKTIGQNDAIEKINNDPTLTPAQKGAQILAIAQQLPAVGNTYSKKVKEYAANSIAAHGGMNALDTMPEALKVEAMNDGLAIGNAAAGVPKPGVVVETKTEDLGGGFKVTTTTETTTTQNAPIDLNAPFDVSTLPPPLNFSTMGSGGGPLYNSMPELNAINTAAAQAMHAAAMLGKTELDKIDPGPSGHLIKYKAALLAKIDGHADDLKAKMKAWTPTTVEVKILDQKHTDPSGVPTQPAKAITLMTAGMSNPKNWLAPAASKIGHFVKVGQVDGKLAKMLYDAIPTIQTGTKGALAKALTKLTSMVPQKYKDAFIAHTKGDYIGRNAALNEQGSKSSKWNEAIGIAKDINAGIYDLPVGFTVIRRMNNLPTDPAYWNGIAGTVMNHPAIASSSIDGSWGGVVLFKIKMAEGVKGAYVGGSQGIKVGDENEVILPRNTKWVVVGAKPYAEAMKTDDFLKTARQNRLADNNSFSPSTVVVEVMAVPHDAPE